MRLRAVSPVLAVFSMILSGSVFGADWGDLKARFVFDGTPPTPRKLEINKDPEVCGKHDLVDESLVVNPTNKGIANVIVYLYTAMGAKAPPIHESYAATAKAEIPFDNHNCRFTPRVVGLRTTQTLLVGNKDSVGHNTNITPGKNLGQNPLIPGNSNFKMNFSIPENLPAPVSCNIHPWMKGWVVIKDHPYIGVSDQDGNVVIKNLPAGKWTFQLYHEMSGYVTEGVVDGKKSTWERGRPEIEIKKEGVEWKEVKLSSSLFKVQ